MLCCPTRKLSKKILIMCLPILDWQGLSRNECSIGKAVR